MTGLADVPDLEAAAAFWSWPGESVLLELVLADVSVLSDAIRQAGSCFLHGDCHTDNILLDHNQLIWADWQNAGLGDPACELAFPSVRATPAGATPPPTRHRGLDAAPLHRAVLAAELAIFLLSWPPYAAYNDERGIQRVHGRVQELGAAWLAGNSDVGRRRR